MATTHFDQQNLGPMVRNLSVEVATNLNMSVESYLSGLSALTHRSHTAITTTTTTTHSNGSDRSAGEKEDEGDGVEVSSGVVWTLVAPLILLGALVVLGVLGACLWKLKDRRCQNVETESENGNAGRDVTTGELELQELPGEATWNFPHPAASRLRGATDQPQRFYRDYNRCGQSAEGETRAWSHSRQHPHGFPTGGNRGQKGIQLTDLDDPTRGGLTTGHGKVNLVSVYGNGQHAHLPSPEDLAQLKAAGVVIQDRRVCVTEEKKRQMGSGLQQAQQERDLHCGRCQPHDQRFAPNPQHPSSQHQHRHYQGHNKHRRVHEADQQQQQQQQRHHQQQHGCKHCVPHQLKAKQAFPFSQSDENRLHLAHRSLENHSHPAISQSLDDHLHLVPRYQPPHPTDVEPRHPRTIVQHGLRHHHDGNKKNRDLSHSTLAQGCYRGLENPLFTADQDNDREANVLDSLENASMGNWRKGRAGMERAREHRVVVEERQLRIINSTSMLSPCEGNDSGTNHLDQGHHAKRHPSGRKPSIVGPDVSSIKLLNNTSQAWRGSHRLLPTTISSTETPSYNSNSNTNSNKTDDHEETLSLPSSISRFHASRVQPFPTLLPDAMYPLTSTKAIFSPSLPCQHSAGENQAGIGRDTVLETLDHFSDNTSMQPNVGSSVTSGDARGSQNVSSVTTEPWPAPSAAKPPSPPEQLHAVRSAKSEGSSNDADTERGTTRQTEDNKYGKVPKQAFPVEAAGTYIVSRGLAVSSMVDNITDDSDLTDLNVRTGSKRSEVSSPDIPNSASELMRRTRSQQGIARLQQLKPERKQGFLLVPKRDSKSGYGGYEYHHGPKLIMPSAVNVREKLDPKHLVSPSRRHGSTCHQVRAKNRVSVAEAGVGHPQNWSYPLTPRNSFTFSTEFPRNPQIFSEDGKPPSGRRSGAKQERHPAKLYSCKPPDPHAAHGYYKYLHFGQQQKQYQLNTAQLPDNREGKVVLESNDKADHHSQPGRRSLHTTYPIPELMQLKASTLSVSLPSVNVPREKSANVSADRHPMASTLDNRTSRASRMKPKKAKSHEDYAYINMGSSFFDDPHETGRNRDAVPGTPTSGMARDLQVPLIPGKISQQTPVMTGKETPSAITGREQNATGLPNAMARTDSQILVDVINSFPRNTFPANTRTSDSNNNENNNIDGHLFGTLYPEVTIPTAFADELFGLWSLSPELDDDISPSQPRTPLMTPLKEEARRANHKFIWGNSGSPSGSTSTSSFAPGVQQQQQQQQQEDALSGAITRRARARQKHGDNSSDDYVQMDNNNNKYSNSSNSAQPHSSPAQMSISDPTSTSGSVNPTLDDLKKNVDLDNDLEVGEEYKGLPLNNLNLSHLYVISGEPDSEDLNNNPVPISTSTSNLGVGVTGVSPRKTVSTSKDPVRTPHPGSAPSAFAIVLNEEKYWL